MLGAVVPHEEGGADRTEAESEDRQPLHALRHHRRLPEQVTSKSQQRDGAAETADHFGRHRAEASVQHRIGRPSQRAGGGGEVAEGVARVEGKRAALGDQDGGAGKAHGGAGEMEPAQPLARQQRREDDDEQRPEVGDEAGIDRGRIAERSEEHTSELQSLMRISYAVFCLKKKKKKLTERPQSNTETRAQVRK